jgi:hypothetical protein
MTTITLRAVKGSPLTNAEVDTNFDNLNLTKVEKNSETGSAQLPVGTTAQRAGNTGSVRYNSSTDDFEGKKSGGWGSIGGGYASKVISVDTTLAGFTEYTTGSATEIAATATLRIPATSLVRFAIYTTGASL